MLVKAVPLSDLHAAYRQGRCPICALNERDERRYIDIALYDQVTNVTWRAQIRDARGFCAPHTTRILDEGRSALGIALIADDLVKTLRETLRVGSPESGRAWSRLRGAFGGAGRAFAAALRGTQPCHSARICSSKRRCIYVHCSRIWPPTSDKQHTRRRRVCVSHIS